MCIRDRLIPSPALCCSGQAPDDVVISTLDYRRTVLRGLRKYRFNIFNIDLVIMRKYRNVWDLTTDSSGPIPAATEPVPSTRNHRPTSNRTQYVGGQHDLSDLPPMPAGTQTGRALPTGLRNIRGDDFDGQG